MKTILFSICTVFYTCILRSQYVPLVVEDHYWKCLSYGWGTQYFDNFISGDSTYMNHEYKKVWIKHANQPDYFEGLIREDLEEEKVYINIYLSEYLLYDFSLEVGETASVYGVGDFHSITVTEVTTAIVGGEIRKKIVFDELNGWSPGYWIEGVGSVYGLTTAALGQIVDYSPNLTCFYEANTLAWSNPAITEITCESTIELTELDKISFSIFPNPANDFVSIRASNNTLGSALTVGVYSIDGQLVLTDQVKNRGLDVSALAPGMYFLKLYSSDTLCSTVKLTVN